MNSFTTTIEDKHLIPFYFPLTGKLIYANPKFFNEKWAGYQKSSDDRIRCFKVLTLEEAKKYQKKLDKRHTHDIPWVSLEIIMSLREQIQSSQPLPAIKGNGYPCVNMDDSIWLKDGGWSQKLLSRNAS